MAADAPPETWYPRFEVAQLRASYERNPNPALADQLLKIVKEDRMLTFYQKFVEQFKLKPDMKLIQEMQAETDAKVKTFDERLEDSKENAGDLEVKNVLLDKAEFYTQIGDKEKGLLAYEQALEKTVGSGGRLDNVLARVRICLFFDDIQGSQKMIEMAHAELKKGGDWERKNKLKVYEGVFKIMTKNFTAAANLLLDSVATFTAVELLPFQEFVFYAVLCSMIGLGRSEVKARVIESPEILSVIHERAHMKEFLFGFYECDYRTWTREFVHMIDHVKEDRYLCSHLMHITKALRLNAYRQFITSYKSVTIKLMAETFGVTPAFIDQEVFELISQGKLNCKIDQVSSVIETIDDRGDKKTQLYKEVISTGDDLLNKMQKLSAAMDR